MTKPPSDYFTAEHAQHYDELNSKLAPISDNLHFLIRLILEDLPPYSKILSVGAGTGAEILSLANAFPNWSFVAVEPSLSMLDVCKARMRNAGLSDRCEFVHGFAHDLPAQADFDAAMAVLVAHFVKREERLAFFKTIIDRLQPGGYLVNAEISCDLDSAEFPAMLRNWQAMQTFRGGTPESLSALPQQLKEVLAVLSPGETESVLRESGIDLPVRFFQAFMICAWYGVKNVTSPEMREEPY